MKMKGEWRQFAIINGRLAEIFFDDTGNNTRCIEAHCYIKKETFTTKQEQRWIEKDVKRNRFSYRNQRYKSLTSRG